MNDSLTALNRSYRSYKSYFGVASQKGIDFSFELG